MLEEQVVEEEERSENNKKINVIDEFSTSFSSFDTDEIEYLGTWGSLGVSGSSLITVGRLNLGVRDMSVDGLSVEHVWRRIILLRFSAKILAVWSAVSAIAAEFGSYWSTALRKPEVNSIVNTKSGESLSQEEGEDQSPQINLAFQDNTGDEKCRFSNRERCFRR